MDSESNECITMRFPIGNKIFERFNNLSIKEQESVISLGLTMLKSGKEKNLTFNNEEWDKKFRDKKEEYEKEKKKMHFTLVRCQSQRVMCAVEAHRNYEKRGLVWETPPGERGNY